jgi:hypothetical protein
VWRRFIVRFIRPFVTAISVLALTAAAATAHPLPTASADGLATATGASGHAVAAGHLLAHEDLNQKHEQEPDANVDEDDVDEQTTEDEQTGDEQQGSEEDSHCIAPVTDGTEAPVTNDEPTVDEPAEEPNHGGVVCGAAHAETPEGYANHGAYVSEVAKENHGHQPPEAAATKRATNSSASAGGHGKGHAKHKS